MATGLRGRSRIAAEGAERPRRTQSARPGPSERKAKCSRHTRSPSPAPATPWGCRPAHLQNGEGCSVGAPPPQVAIPHLRDGAPLGASPANPQPAGPGLGSAGG